MEGMHKFGGLHVRRLGLKIVTIANNMLLCIEKQIVLCRKRMSSQMNWMERLEGCTCQNKMLIPLSYQSQR